MASLLNIISVLLIFLCPCFADNEHDSKYDHPVTGKTAADATQPFGLPYYDYKYPASNYPIYPTTNKLYTVGFIDPMLLVILIALPFLAVIAFGSLIMPLIPILIYLITTFFPTGAGTPIGRRKRHADTLDPTSIETQLSRFLLDLAFNVEKALAKYDLV